MNSSVKREKMEIMAYSITKWGYIVLATKNQGKVKELAKMMQEFNIEVKSLGEYDHVPEIIEDGSTFMENAVKKATTISEYMGVPALADDSGLEVEALGGRPGVFSARYAGMNATDEENNTKLIHELQGVPEENRKARFCCALAFVIPGEEMIQAEGACEGEIILEPRGSKGFGYDPVFFLPELGKTMAELTPEEKNQISHRGKAYRALIRKLREKMGEEGE